MGDWYYKWSCHYQTLTTNFLGHFNESWLKLFGAFWFPAIFLQHGQNKFLLSAVRARPGIEGLKDLLSPPLKEDLAWPPLPW